MSSCAEADGGGLRQRRVQWPEPLCVEPLGDMFVPVMFRPAYCVASYPIPALTGSLPMVKTIGIVKVAGVATRAAGSPPPATISAT